MAGNTTLFKLSGCRKYFWEEAIWAIKHSVSGKFWIEQKDFGGEPCFAVYMSRSTEDKNDITNQIGWIKESDKTKFIDFCHDIESVSHLHVEYESGHYKMEVKQVEILVRVSK